MSGAGLLDGEGMALSRVLSWREHVKTKRLIPQAPSERLLGLSCAKSSVGARRLLGLALLGLLSFCLMVRLSKLSTN